MKRIFVLILTLALCLSLCACGSNRMNDSATEYRTETTERPGGTTDTVKNRTTGNGAGTTDRKTDMTPDPQDGKIEDGSADDGVIEEERSTPSPKVTHRP